MIKTFTIQINDDNLVESDETVNLILVKTAGGAVLGNQNTAVLTIVDNDSKVNPKINSFLPTSGKIGTSVSISGAGFTGATTVKFNDTAARVFNVVSDSLITADVPAGA